MGTGLRPRKRLIKLALMGVAILPLVACEQSRNSAPGLAATDGCSPARVRDLRGPDSATLQGEQLQALIDQCHAVAAKQRAAAQQGDMRGMDSSGHHHH